jgi:hypothetical protein
MRTTFLGTITAVVCAVMGLTVGLSAQQASPGRTVPPKIHAESVTLTGCVTQGLDADHYVLANAVRREEPAKSTAKAGASRTVRSDKDGASDRTGPYDLAGAEFKAHLGHLVEVTGTGGTTGKTTSTTTGESVPERQPLPRFNVQAVKMLSATCS